MHTNNISSYVPAEYDYEAYKDAFYFYKSVWNSEPMVHITEKRFTELPSPVPQIKAYSNGSSA